MNRNNSLVSYEIDTLAVICNRNTQHGHGMVWHTTVARAYGSGSRMHLGLGTSLAVCHQLLGAAAQRRRSASAKPGSKLEYVTRMCS